MSCYVWRGSLSPIYTIQPVVKPVWQPGTCLYTQYNRLYNPVWQPAERTAVRSTRLWNRFVKHGLTTGWTNRLTTGWMLVYTIQPVVKTVVQPVWQPVVSCKRGFKQLFIHLLVSDVAVFVLKRGLNSNQLTNSLTYYTHSRREALRINSTIFVKGRISLLSPNQQCQSSEGNTEHWPQPVAWPHPFFIHRQTSEGTACCSFWHSVYDAGNLSIHGCLYVTY